MSSPSIMSGNTTIDYVFDACVGILLWGAGKFGISYNEINIWVFCVLWPIFTIALIILAVRQRETIKQLQLGETQNG